MTTQAADVAGSFDTASTNAFMTFQVGDYRLLGTKGGFLQVARVFPVMMPDDGERMLGDPMIVQYRYSQQQAPMKFGGVYTAKAAGCDVSDVRPSTIRMLEMPDIRDGALVAVVAEISPANRQYIEMKPAPSRANCRC